MSTLVDFPMKPEARPYLDAFAETASEARWLRDARRHGLSRFAELGFPSRRSEQSRDLNLEPLEKAPLQPRAVSREVSEARLADIALACPTHRLAFVNASYSPALSGVTGVHELPEGVWLGPVEGG